jgi:hypothetical protein
MTRKRWAEGLCSIPGLRDVPFAAYATLMGLPALGVGGDRNGRICGEAFLARHATPEDLTVVMSATVRGAGGENVMEIDGAGEGENESKGVGGRKRGARGASSPRPKKRQRAK